LWQVVRYTLRRRVSIITHRKLYSVASMANVGACWARADTLNTQWERVGPRAKRAVRWRTDGTAELFLSPIANGHRRRRRSRTNEGGLREKKAGTRRRGDDMAEWERKRKRRREERFERASGEDRASGARLARAQGGGRRRETEKRARGRARHFFERVVKLLRWLHTFVFFSPNDVTGGLIAFSPCVRCNFFDVSYFALILGRRSWLSRRDDDLSLRFFPRWPIPIRWSWLFLLRPKEPLVPLVHIPSRFLGTDFTGARERNKSRKTQSEMGGNEGGKKEIQDDKRGKFEKGKERERCGTLKKKVEWSTKIWRENRAKQRRERERKRKKEKGREIDRVQICMSLSLARLRSVRLKLECGLREFESKHAHFEVLASTDCTARTRAPGRAERQTAAT